MYKLRDEVTDFLVNELGYKLAGITSGGPPGDDVVEFTHATKPGVDVYVAYDGSELRIKRCGVALVLEFNNAPLALYKEDKLLIKGFLFLLEVDEAL